MNFDSSSDLKVQSLKSKKRPYPVRYDRTKGCPVFGSTGSLAPCSQKSLFLEEPAKPKEGLPCIKRFGRRGVLRRRTRSVGEIQGSVANDLLRKRVFITNGVNRALKFLSRIVGEVTAKVLDVSHELMRTRLIFSTDHGRVTIPTASLFFGRPIIFKSELSASRPIGLIA